MAAHANLERRVSIQLDLTQDGVLNNVIVTPGTPTPEEMQSIENSVSAFPIRGSNAPPVSISTSTTPAVSIRQACKSYTPGKPILDNMDMTVPRGTIYGLLGSSGCGKTTILSTIVGLKELDSGDIFVFGSRPGTKGSGIPGRRLGYMPQDIALYEYLTIKEILQYFGRIFGMTATEIDGQTEFLVNFLQLPNRNKKICALSGGQKRRSSLAASLIHDPQLLILDEPTVGLDPLLRESIWNHLYQLVTTRRTTVIITTHYIEEARHSHTVGLMRNGRLLAEKAPDTLLKEHKTHLLEDIVLKLCRKDLSPSLDSHKATNGNGNNNNNGKNGKKNDVVAEALSEISFYSRINKMLPLSRSYKHEMNQDKPEVVGLKFQQTAPIGDAEPTRKRHSSLKRRQSFIDTLSDDMWFRASRIRALTVRNYLNFFRNPVFVLGVVFLPSVQMILTSLIVGQDPQHMRFGVANHEFSGWEERCSKDLKSNVCGADLSCRYLNQLKYQNGDFFDLVPVEKESDAVDEVRLGKMWGYISFPENYSEYVGLRSGHGLFADNETLEGSIVKLRLDMSHYLAGVFMINNLFSSFQEYLKGSISTCGGSPKEVELPFNYSAVYGSVNSRYMEYIIPGALILIIYLITLCSCAVSVIGDRKQGTLDRSRVAGIQTFDIMISYFITEGTTVLFQAALGASILILGFNLEVQGSTVLFLFVCIITGLCGQASGLLIGILCPDEVEALFLGMFFYLPMMLLAGVIWPLEAMPDALRYFSYCLPLTLTCESLRSITSRGLGLLHPKVWPGVAVVSIWTVSFWIIALCIFRSLKKQ
ncbi:unnamed protein product [Orchesella dallaii]|uniref:ABC transporter G family member 23 n=1 Tax=Orchesella dallaii TaxID=48710 RepID=A0ABP1PRI9_9HEXA